MKVEGFTLIEVALVVAIVSILALIASTFISSNKTTCINGYVFVKGYSVEYGGSNIKQILDDQGHGIKCGVTQ